MNLDANTKYRESHEWVRWEDDLIVCGISDHAQENLSDIVYVEFPELGDSFNQGDIFGVIESVKAASDLYMPMSGEIVEINEELEDTPDLVNNDSLGEGWLMKFKPADPDEWNSLLTADDYEKSIVVEE